MKGLLSVRAAGFGLAVLAIALVATSLAVWAPAKAAGDITFVGAPGTSAPPSTLGPYTMTTFPDDARAIPNDVTSVPSPLGGSLGFSITMSHVEIGSGWATWSHGYTGDVYSTQGALSVTMTMPANTGAFYFYAEPDPFAIISITATADDGATSGPVPVDGSGGAQYFGFWAQPGTKVVSITVTSPSPFAVGEFGIAASITPTGTPPPTATARPNVSGPVGAIAAAAADQARENRERAAAAAAAAAGAVNAPVSPPSTGQGSVSITPPSTGDAGLADRQDSAWLAVIAVAATIGLSSSVAMLRAARRG